MIKFIVAFSVYTLAMIGVIVIAFLVWRNAFMGGSSKNGTIKVEESLNLNSRKTLHVIRIENERFLIAADVDKTTFLAKLNDNENIASISKSNFDSTSFKNAEDLGKELIDKQKPATMRNILQELKRNRVE